MVTVSREAVELGIRFRIPVKAFGIPGRKGLSQCECCRRVLLPSGLEDKLRAAFRRQVQHHDPLTVGSYADLTPDGRSIDVTLWFGGMLTPLEQATAVEEFEGLRIFEDGVVVEESRPLLQPTPFARAVEAIVSSYRST